MVDVVIPRIGESISTVFVSKWLKQAGDAVQEGEPLIELDSDKASMELPSPATGVLRELLVKAGDEIPVLAVVGRIEAGAVAQAQAPAAAVAPVSAASPKAGPAARHAAVEEGVSLSGVQGSGPRGRIVTEDVHKAARPSPAVVAAPPAARPAPVAGAVERVPMSPLRRTVARRLLQASQETAMLTTFNEVDMSRILGLRKRYQDDFVKRHGVKLGFMSFFVKAAIEALKEFPSVNAEIDGNDIVYKHFYHIGVAVSGPKGLVVPVVRDADRLSFAETEQAIGGLAVKAKDNKLKPEDFEGGTFTISNGGIFGSMMSTPILNPPQVGILGMHNILERPVGVDGQVVLRPMMYLALSYDHRIIDGKEAVSFLVRVKQCVEDPERILLET
jgi:2-oxoglutarate dehydrogenase E2 component (dihydrolipoamide succinyltransferase)